MKGWREAAAFLHPLGACLAGRGMLYWTKKGAAGMEKEDNRRVWLGITYTVPAKPSRARVYIWRKLKELGAEYYHGMAMVPQTPRLQESIKKLVARIRELGAEVSVLEIRFADPADEEKVVAQFRRQAENDFRELFLDFARLYEELGGPLDGDGDQRRILRRRYGKVKSRDFFHVAEEPDFSAGLTQLAEDIRLSGGFPQLLDDIQLSTGELYRQFVALFSEK